jgi:hypothetical protein
VDYSIAKMGWGPRVKTHMHQNSHDQRKEDEKITQVRRRGTICEQGDVKMGNISRREHVAAQKGKEREK